MASILFHPIVAVHPVTGDLVRNASGQVYAEGDTAFANPLAITDALGTPVPSVAIGPNALTQAFRVDEALLADSPSKVVVWKSGDNVLQIWSPRGLVDLAQAAGITPTERTTIASAVPQSRLDRVAFDVRNAAGVVGDGVADDATAIQAAANAAASLGLRLYATGTFRTGSTVTLSGDADLSGATFNYSGTGVAIQVGDPASVLWRKRIQLPTLVATAKTAVGWAQVAGSIGVKIVNANSCAISGTRISNFETGMLIYGAQGIGCAYNYIQMNHLDNNKIQQDIAADATGWSNENQYRIARFSFNSNEGAVVPGTRCIRIQTAPSIPNNNIWIGGSVEANTPEYHVECAGGDSRFLSMRWENGSVGARVWWRTGAFRNIIDGGYDAHRITETYESGSPQTLLTGQGWKVRQSAAKGVLQVENYNSSATSAITIMPAGAGAAGTDAATGYAATLSANLWALKRPTDTFDRIQLDAVNSRIYFGSGAAALTRYISNLGTSGISVNGGNWCPGTDNTLDLGIGGFRWRYVRAGTAIQPGAFTTATRPAAATAGAGAMIFDTTLNKPVWVNAAATGYVDATGAAV